MDPRWKLLLDQPSAVFLFIHCYYCIRKLFRDHLALLNGSVMKILLESQLKQMLRDFGDDPYHLDAASVDYVLKERPLVACNYFNGTMRKYFSLQP